MDHLLRARGDTTQLQQDAAAYGITIEPHHLQPVHYRLWAELWPPVQLFMRCLTQWRVADGRVLGLDYGPLFLMAPLLGIELTAAMMDDIQQLELHGRELLNRRKS